MRRLIRASGGIAGLALFAAPAHAVDASKRFSGPVISSAFYAGAHGGSSLMVDTLTQSDNGVPFFTSKLKPHPVFGGLHVGFQRSFGSLMVGLEADVDGLNASASKTVAGTGTTTYNRSITNTYQGSFRSRLGYDFGAVVLYATGGVAVTTLKATSSASTAPANQTSMNLASGWTVGAGAQYMLTTQWAAYTEYRYTDFGNVSVAADGGLNAGSTANHQFVVQSLRVGATYFFR